MSRHMRKLWVPLLSTAIMLAILISLGVWQLQRREWKAGLLAQIDAAEQQPAIALPSEPQPFQKVRVEGRFRTDLVALYAFEVRDQKPGAHLIVPLERTGQPTILVDLGFVPDAMPRPIAVEAGAVEGFIRPAEQASTFSGGDNIAGRHFYTLNPALIGNTLGLAQVAPYTLVALAPLVPRQYPEPAHAMPRPPNDHLNYALTWFGFAITLLVIFILYARKASRA
jgi:surfeit locus 1 family protein